MAKTAFLLICLVSAFAGTSYAGRLDDFLRINEKRVDCRRADESIRSGPGLPEYYVTTIPKDEVLAYAQNPEFKYRTLYFMPKGLIGNTPLPFNKPLCAGLAIDPAAIGDQTQQMYVDTNWELYLAEYGEGTNEYKPVRLHYDPDAKSLFVPFTHGENVFRLCVVDGPDGVKLSQDCKSKYDLEQEEEEKK